ncbi:MAG: nicotinamide-nucleotide adenylyltransferase [Desulfurococcaceae archaeon]
MYCLKRIMFPGRFQPFHLGHLYVFEKIIREYDEVVFIIGSAQDGFTCSNPFTAGERIEMINETLKYYGYSRDQYWLIPVPDINKPLAWTAYVLAMTPRVDAVVSGNPHVQYIYEWFGLKVVKIDLINPDLYNGTYIRKLILNDSDWEKLVPKPVVDYIKSINGVERIKRVCRHGFG